MWGNTRPLFKILTLSVAVLLFTGLALPLRGQEPLPEIFITGNDITTPPNSVLHVYGRDAQGNAIDFAADPLVLTSEGTAIETVVSGTHPAGTLTVFLIDLPIGIEEQLPAIQQAIQQFAGPGGGMNEQVDSIAIYQVGATEPKELLPPTTFYNEVQNFFVDDLTPETGATALRDSLAILLDEVETLKPRPDMVTSVVVMSDGTDVVSTQYEPQEIITRANEQHIPVHTIWVAGAGLTAGQQEQGQTYLREGAQGTRGFAALLDDSASVNDLWNRIAAFRDQARVAFQMDSLGGGSYDVVLSLASDPLVSDSMVVDIPENQPQVSLNLPPGSDELVMESLDEPILLRLGATVSWLDNLEREISEARIRVNGLDIADIPVDQLDDFTVEVSNLQFGPNELELLVIDEQGLRASNLPATISVTQGDQTVVPQELQPGPEIGSIVLNVFLAIVVLSVLVGLFFWLRRSGFFSRFTRKGRSRRPDQSITYSYTDDPAAVTGMSGGIEQSAPPFYAHLDVVEAVSEMPSSLELTGAMVRIGRSPSMCDIAFKDDLTVSRQHAVLMLEGHHYRLFDENSTSGTWVNGRQVPDYGIELADGDEMHLGAVHLVYRQI